MRDAPKMIFNLSLTWIWRSDQQVLHKVSRLESVAVLKRFPSSEESIMQTLVITAQRSTAEQINEVSLEKSSFFPPLKPVIHL